LIVCGCAIAAVATAAAARYRQTTAIAVALVLCLIVVWFPLRSAIEPAYPTSFYAAAEPYTAASVARSTALYAEHCALCHGETGRGDGPAVASLPILPADLTEPHLFAHSPGDLFWWVSHGMDEGIMPGFADALSSNQRWDVINFVRARAAGALSTQVGPEVTTAAAPEVPDFAFEASGAQRTLRQTLEKGPVLLVLFAPPVPKARLRQLGAEQPALAAAGLQVIAVSLAPAAQATSEEAPPLVVEVSSEVVATLALFRAADDGGEVELMLDRAGNVRARWTGKTPGGLPSPDTLIAQTDHIGRTGVATPTHAGHIR